MAGSHVGKGRPRIAGRALKSHKSRRILSTELVFHVLVLAWYLRVWLWHFSAQAAQLPGAKGFGWFTRYLTFYSFSLQLLQLILCCVSVLLPGRPSVYIIVSSNTLHCQSNGPLVERVLRHFIAQLPFFVASMDKAITIWEQDLTHSRMTGTDSRNVSVQQQRVGQWADDLSCALFGLANVVTIMFYTLEATTKAMTEGGSIERPPWLGFAVHVSNSITAWLDLLISKQRSFSTRSSRLSLVLVAFYTIWILVSSHFNRSFPYPFLNHLPWPQGFLGVMLSGQVLFYFLFKLGKRIRMLLQYVRKTAESAVSQKDLNVKVV